MSIKSLIFGFLILWIFSGCSFYHPMMTDIPLIREKNELRIDGSISLIPAVQTTVSYGLTDKIAIQGYGTVGADEKYYFQAAAGHFKNIGANKVLELYGGMGYGHGNAYNGSNAGDLYGNYQLYFGQANFGAISGASSKFEIGLGLKLGYMHSNLTDRNYYYGDYDWATEEGKIYRDNSILFEPVGFMRIGGERLQFSLKIGAALMYTFTPPKRELPYNYINYAFGINYRFRNKAGR